jgi:hypothetical protein
MGSFGREMTSSIIYKITMIGQANGFVMKSRNVTNAPFVLGAPGPSVFGQ